MNKRFRDIICRYSDICVERGYRNGIYNDYWMGKAAAIDQIIGAINGLDGWMKKSINFNRDGVNKWGK